MGLQCEPANVVKQRREDLDCCMPRRVDDATLPTKHDSLRSRGTRDSSGHKVVRRIDDFHFQLTEQSIAGFHSDQSFRHGLLPPGTRKAGKVVSLVWIGNFKPTVNRAT